MMRFFELRMKRISLLCFMFQTPYMIYAFLPSTLKSCTERGRCCELISREPWCCKNTYSILQNPHQNTQTLTFLKHNDIIVGSKILVESSLKIMMKREGDNEEKDKNTTLQINQRKEEQKKNPPNKDEKTEEQQRDLLYVSEPRILAGDICSILIAGQLIGLVDVLQDSTFWDSGGFLQPISLHGITTLRTIVKRDSILSICWILAALKNNGYCYGAIVDYNTAIKCTFSIFTDFCSLLIISAFIMALSTQTPVDGWEILREAWFTILMMCTFRTLYSQFN